MNGGRGPDVLGVCEVENRHVLEQLATALVSTGRQYAVVHAEFGTLNRAKGTRTTFALEYAAEGPLAGVPTLIRHRPRWWLEAVLTLDGG